MDRLRTSKPHDWIDLDRYVTIYEETLRMLGGYVVASHNLEVSGDGRLLSLQGSVACCDGHITLYVNNTLEVNERSQVRGRRYRYHAELVGPPARPILRYDNSHTYVREGHPDAYHKHTWNHLTWKPTGPPQWIGLYHWPTLGQVIEEIWDWWQVIGQHLDDT